MNLVFCLCLSLASQFSSPCLYRCRLRRQKSLQTNKKKKIGTAAKTHDKPTCARGLGFRLWLFAFLTSFRLFSCTVHKRTQQYNQNKTRRNHPSRFKNTKRPFVCCFCTCSAARARTGAVKAATSASTNGSETANESQNDNICSFSVFVCCFHFVCFLNVFWSEDLCFFVFFDCCDGLWQHGQHVRLGRWRRQQRLNKQTSVFTKQMHTNAQNRTALTGTAIHELLAIA